ncbi:MAG: hypothetical protein OXU77_21865 [Gammaproteobacteria bacterium]|nr:hypothetical protein [Gammaproteobacteria bacterium]
MEKVDVLHVDELSSRQLGQFDAFVCSASYERRCLSVPCALREGEVPLGRTLVVFNGNYEDVVRLNLDTLRSLFVGTSDCTIDTGDPVATAIHLHREINEICTHVGTPRRIGVDITTFTRESLLIMLSCLWQVLEQSDEVVLFYCRALEYDSRHEGSAKWLSRGIREVRSVIGYPGNLRPSRRSHLVVLAGFEDDRALRLIAEVEPAVVSVGIPDEAGGHAADHSATADLKMRSIRRVVGDVREFRFNAYDPYGCFRSVGREVKRTSGMNTILAPMNTKISTVSAGMFAMVEPDVQLCYAQAELYNLDAYSEPGKDVYVFCLPLHEGVISGL